MAVYRNLLAARVHDEINDVTLTEEDCKNVIELAFKEIARVLSETSEEVIISNFGTFKTNDVAERVSTDFNGETVTVPGHKRVAFKTSKALKERLKQ